MESKAQKEAIAKIEELGSKFEKGGFSGGSDYYGSPYPDVNDFLGEINEVIKNYGLEDILDVLEPVYDALMKKGYYEEAASFAKKYGL